VVRFGVFEADLRSGELHKCGVKVKIQELPFQALKLLVSHPNEVVSREDLRQVLWPDGVYVEFDRGVISAINRLRDSLGDSAENPIFIETVGRRGYRWIAPLHFPDPAHNGVLRDHSTAQGPEETAVWPVVSMIGRLVTQRSNLFFVLLVAALLFVVGASWIKRDRSNTASKTGASTVATRASSARAPANREAEKFYLEGRYYWEKRTPESLSKAVDSFTQAIVHDPGYAPAYVGLADSYNLLREYTVMPANEAYPRALAAAKKAVELDPQSSEAHASLAFASFFGMWDAPSADREFQRAIELNPNNSVAHHWYASYLSSMRRYAQALGEIERAQALDPASKSVLADKGALLFDAGRRQESIALLQQMADNEPDFVSPYRYLEFIYLMMHDCPSYLVAARKEAVLMHNTSAVAIVDSAEKGFASGGERGLLAVLSSEQQRLFDKGRVSPFILAKTYSIMGDKREALRYLRIGYERRADGMTQVAADPAFAILYGEPAFQKLLADIGLPPVG